MKFLVTMHKKLWFLIVAVCAFAVTSLYAQTIVYSEPDKNDTRGLDFEIIGKMNNHYLIYKNVHANNQVSIYDNDMKLVTNEKLSFLPDKIINSDILAYKNFFYFFYQYQHRNVVYCKAAKLDSDAKLIGEPQTLDTTQISFLANNKVYSYVVSEDKQKIGFIKINTKNENSYFVTSIIFDDSLTQLSKSYMSVDIPERNDFLTEFNIDNDGDIVFVRAAGGSQKDNVVKLTLISKRMNDNLPKVLDLPLNKIYLDDIRVKVDNYKKDYLVTSFYTNSRRGNVDGLYASLYSKTNDSLISTTLTIFNEDLRNDVKSSGNSRFAFNDFFLQKVVMRKDGGFVIAAESVYSSTRGNQYNRWDYFNNSPYYPSSANYYYSYSNPYGYYYPWSRGGYGFQNTRYFADNIALLSFDSTGNLSWSRVIHKSQYDDNTDDFIGYNTMNTGTEVHFLYNETVRKNVLLSDQVVTPDGQLTHSPTLHNLDRGYEFMPRLGKQVGAKQMIIPCTYRNYICFAKVDF